MSSGIRSTSSLREVEGRSGRNGQTEVKLVTIER